MNNKFKLCSRVVIFIIAIFFILKYTSMIFIPKNNIEGAGMEDVSANGILTESENSIDVLILGDSEAYASFSPMAMYNKYGFTSYNCGTVLQQLSYSEKLLKRTLESQSPKVVMIETNTIFRSVMANDIIGDKLSNVFPILKYHNRWKSLHVTDFTNDINYSYDNEMKGFEYRKEVREASNESEYMAPTTEVQKIPDLNKIILNRIIDICKENNIELILVSTPSTVNWNTKKHNAVDQFASEHDITYLDLNMPGDCESIDWTKETRDCGDHLNFKGAMKVTRFIGNYLSNNYSLPDHRDDANYEKWNEDLAKYKDIVSK